MCKFQTGIWNQSLRGRVEVRILHGYRLSSEEICSEYAAQPILLQGQSFPTEKSQILSVIFYLKKSECVKKARIPKFGFKSPNWQSWILVKYPSFCEMRQRFLQAA